MRCCLRFLSSIGVRYMIPRGQVRACQRDVDARPALRTPWMNLRRVDGPLAT